MSCKSTPDTLVEDCDNQCNITVYDCPGASMSPEIFQRCTEGCQERLTDAMRVGMACEQAFEVMMKCVGTLTTCQEISDWSLRAESNPCMASSHDYKVHCPDM